MMAFEIITYGAGPYLTNVFNGIAALVNTEDYGTVLNIVFIVAIFGIGYLAIVRANVVMLTRWFVGYAMAYSLLFVPQSEVMIIDRIYADTPQVVKHVPFGVAVLAHFSSQIGDSLTRLFETAFSTPDDIKYHQTGMMMASSMIEKTAFLPLLDERFAKNMRNFIHQCVVYEAIRGKKYTLDDLKKSDNVWELISKNASKAHAFPFNNEIITCHSGAATLGQEWEKQLEKMKASYANRYYRQANTDGIDKAIFLTHLPGAYEYLLGVSRTAESILQQQLMLQSLIDGVESFSSETGSAAAVQQFASSRAKIQQHAAYTIVGQLALEKLPLMRAIFECLLYGIFPIVFLLVLLPQGTGILLMYTKALFWVHSWGPLFALLNVFFSYSARLATISAATSSAGVGISLETLPGIYDVNAKMAAFAGFMSSFIPILSWSIFKNGPGVLANMSASLFGINQSSATSAAEEATTGNLRYGNSDFGNHHLNNFSANKFDSSGSVAMGAFKMHDADMVHYTVSPAGGTIADSSAAISRTGTHVNAAEAIRDIAGQQSSLSQKVASNQQHVFEERSANFVAASALLGKHLSHENSSGQSYNVNQSHSIAEFAKQMHDEVERKTNSEGDTTSKGDQESLTGYIRGNIGKSFSLFGFRGAVEGGAELNKRKYEEHSQSHSHQESKDQSDTVGSGVSHENSFRVLAEELRRSGDSEGASLAEKADVALQEAVSSSMAWQTAVSESQAWSEMHSQQTESSSNASYNMDQEIFSRIAEMPSPGSSTGKMGAIQAANLLNNPVLAKEYLQKALPDIIHERMSQKIQTMSLEKEAQTLNETHAQAKKSLKESHYDASKALDERYAFESNNSN